MTHLVWKTEFDKCKPDTFEEHCYNNDGEHLGYLSWERCGRFMQWIWHQNPEIGMSSGCLDELRQRQKELYAIKRKK